MKILKDELDELSAFKLFLLVNTRSQALISGFLVIFYFDQFDCKANTFINCTHFNLKVKSDYT